MVKDFKCALPIRGGCVAVQMVGAEAVLSLCEVQVFSTEGKAHHHNNNK